MDRTGNLIFYVVIKSVIMNNTHKFFYKYRSVNHNDLENDKALDALFKSYTIFASRKNFNDPFDSKVIFTKPSIIEFKNIINYMNYKNPLTKDNPKLNQKLFIDKNQKITDKGIDIINETINSLNKLIDSYTFLSLSVDSKNILLWAHYAGSYSGYCIEFRSQCIDAQKVIYKTAVPTFNISDLLATGDKDKDLEIGRKISTALLTKLIDWEYEREYRLHLSDDTKYTPLNNQNKRVNYKPDFIESVIFGSRMPEKTKNHIIKNIPYSVVFKQAHELDSSIEIRPYKE